MTSKPGTIKPSRIILLFIGLLILMGLVAYVVTELNYQSSISDMKKVLADASQNVLQPAGGQEHWSATVTHGSNFIESLGCIDTNCPQVEAYWYVPLSAKEFNSFKDKVVGNIKNNPAVYRGWSVEAYPADVSNNDLSKLPELPESKIWQAIHIFIYK